jgi:hypothetical protein
VLFYNFVTGVILVLSVLSSDTIRAERARRNFALFVRDAWPELEPSTPLLMNWHIEALCAHLQALYERQITRLLIGIAPGHAKSTIVSQMFPVWCWINDPYSRWLCASHSLDLAIRDNRYRRRLIESEWFKSRYGHIFTFAPDQRVKGYYENSKKGYHMALAVRSSGTGKRADALLIDDANNAMAGPADIAATVEWYGKMWVSRQNDQERGMSIVVGQRLGSDDLISHILKLGGFEHLCLPEEFEPARRCFTKIGWTDPRKEEGELLWPEKFPKPVLDKLKAELGSLHYAAQYQQSPVPAGGAIFKEKWFRYCSIEGDYYELETPEGVRHVAIKDCLRFTVVDLAVSTKQSADWTVIQTYDVTPQNELLLIDQVRGHFDNPTQQKLIRLTYFRLKPQFVQIEAVAYQLALVQQLRDEPVEDSDGRKYSIPIKEYKPVRDKVSRASAPAILMENGKFYFLKTLTDLHIIKTEYLQFPKGSNDDIVDCGGQAAEVIFVPHGPMIWGIEDESDARSLESVPVPGAVPVPSMFSHHVKDFDDGELYDMEASDRW